MTAADVEAIRQTIEAHEKLRLLVSIDEVVMPAPGVLGSNTVAMKQLALQNVERYAVVGGPDWIRAFVGAMDPLFTMEVRHFRTEDGGWAWLAGAALAPDAQTEAPPAPSAEALPSDRPDLVGLAVSGRLHERDYTETIRPLVDAALAHHDAIDLLVRVDEWDGFSLSAMKAEAGMAPLASSLRRVAIAGAPEWMDHLMKLSAPLVAGEVRSFPTEADARQWLDANR